MKRYERHVCIIFVYVYQVILIRQQPPSIHMHLLNLFQLCNFVQYTEMGRKILT